MRMMIIGPARKLNIIRERFRNFGVEFKVDQQIYSDSPSTAFSDEPEKQVVPDAPDAEPPVKEDLPPADKSDKKLGKRAKKG